MIEKDTLLKTAAGYILKVGEYIKSDRTFDYYKATYSLCPCVLKWYKNPGKKYKKLHKNVRMLTKLDYPYPYVALWPIDVTKIQNGSFGIITEELPDGYIPLSEAVKNLEDKDKWMDAMTENRLPRVQGQDRLIDAGWSVKEVVRKIVGLYRS